jgi:uncharacterized protein
MSIFLDANAPMYSVGTAHPLKEPSIQVLRLVEENQSQFVTSTEMLQEILHRYLSIRNWESGRAVFDRVVELLRGRIQPIYPRDVRNAADLADRYPRVSARDLLHAAVMSRLGVRRIVSTDNDFDKLPDIERLDPIKIAEWRDTVTA